MKVHVVFDDEGHVVAILHFPPEKEGAKNVKKVRLLPGPGQHAEILDVPEEVRHLKPHKLHDSVRVDRTGGTVRLVAKPK